MVSEEVANNFLSLSLSSLIKRIEEEGVMRRKPVSACTSTQTQVRAGFTFSDGPVNHGPVNQGTCNSRPNTRACSSRPDTGGIA